MVHVIIGRLEVRVDDCLPRIQGKPLLKGREEIINLILHRCPRLMFLPVFAFSLALGRGVADRFAAARRLVPIFCLLRGHLRECLREEVKNEGLRTMQL